uniref:ER membrane protein complex subunit 10 n=1 Tax=Romanomermis culicivorax TaxID=13658 RepID=A0A915IXA6_ROMCU
RAANDDALYCVRTKAQPFNVHSNDFVSGCLPACILVMSDLINVLTLAMDSTRQSVVGLSVQSMGVSNQFSNQYPKNCKDINENVIGTELFNTTIRFVEPVEGPVPETQAYLQKIEREKQEKAQGDQGDNRSFLAKYKHFKTNKL